MQKKIYKTVSVYNELYPEFFWAEFLFLGILVIPFSCVYVCYSPRSRWICMPLCVPLLAPGTISAAKGVNSLHYYLDPDSRPWVSSLAFHNVQKRIPQGSTNCKMLFCLVRPVGPACASGGQATTCNLSKTYKSSSFSLAYNVMVSKYSDIMR